MLICNWYQIKFNESISINWRSMSCISRIIASTVATHKGNSDKRELHFMGKCLWGQISMHVIFIDLLNGTALRIKGIFFSEGLLLFFPAIKSYFNTINYMLCMTTFRKLFQSLFLGFLQFYVLFWLSKSPQKWALPRTPIHSLKITQFFYTPYCVCSMAKPSTC